MDTNRQTATPADYAEMAMDYARQRAFALCIGDNYRATQCEVRIIELSNAVIVAAGSVR